MQMFVDEYAGMNISEAQRLRQIEDENRRLKAWLWFWAKTGKCEVGRPKKRLSYTAPKM
jgi:hypothetical protein